MGPIFFNKMTPAPNLLSNWKVTCQIDLKIHKSTKLALLYVKGKIKLEMGMGAKTGNHRNQKPRNVQNVKHSIKLYRTVWHSEGGVIQSRSQKSAHLGHECSPNIAQCLLHNNFDSKSSCFSPRFWAGMCVLSADAIINCWITNYMVAFLGSDKFNALTHICSDARHLSWKYPRDESCQGRRYIRWGSESALSRTLIQVLGIRGSVLTTQCPNDICSGGSQLYPIPSEMRVEGCHYGRLSFGISSNNKQTFSMLFNCPRFPFACLWRINFGGLLLFCYPAALLLYTKRKNT